MVDFDLSRFANLAFGRERLPDHPLRTDKDAAAAVAQLKDEAPENALAQITYYVKSMNDTHSFSPGRRAVVLLKLHEAARPRWRALATRYLKARGRPSERRDGDPNILRALFDTASEFSTGFGISLDEAAASKWVEANLAPLSARKMRWLGRRLALAHMLRLPAVSAVWEALHRLYLFAEAHGAARQLSPLYDGSRFPSSARQEYVRAALLELAGPQSLSAREIELAYRITGRVARMVRAETTASPAAGFAVVPEKDARPGPARRLPSAAAKRSPIYFETDTCVAYLGSEQQQEVPGDPAGPDPLYGGDFTLRERFAVLDHLLAHWGAQPPQRRAQRVSLSAPAEVLFNFDTIAKALAPAEAPPAASAASKLSIDQTGKLQRQARARATAAFPARVIDASSGGLGLSVKGSPGWARHGMLVAVRIEPNKEWMIATVRRIFAPDEQERRVGLQILASHPRSFTFEGEDLQSVWEDAARQEIRSTEVSRRGILLQPEGFARARGEILLPPGIGSRNKRIDVRARGVLRQLRLTHIEDDGAQYERAAYEVLPASVAA